MRETQAAPTSGRRWRPATLAAIVAVIVLAALAAFVVLRPAATAISSAGITIECSGAVELDEAACLAWGEAAIERGPRVRTFNVEDVVRLRFDRELWGFGSTCHAEWYLGRYPDRPVWTDDTPCGDEDGAESGRPHWRHAAREAPCGQWT